MRVSCSVSQDPAPGTRHPASGCWSRKSKIYTNNMLEELDKAWAKRMPATTWQTRLGNVQRQPKEQRVSIANVCEICLYVCLWVCVCVCACVCMRCVHSCVERVWAMRRCRCGYLPWLNLHLFSKGMFKCATNCVWVEDNAHWGSSGSGTDTGCAGGRRWWPGRRTGAGRVVQSKKMPLPGAVSARFWAHSRRVHVQTA